MFGDTVVVSAPGRLFLLEVADDPLHVALIGSVAERGNHVADVGVDSFEVFGLTHGISPFFLFILYQILVLLQ